MGLPGAFTVPGNLEEVEPVLSTSRTWETREPYAQHLTGLVFLRCAGTPAFVTYLLVSSPAYPHAWALVS